MSLPPFGYNLTDYNHVNAIAPFTYRENITYIQKLEQLAAYMVALNDYYNILADFQNKNNEAFTNAIANIGKTLQDAIDAFKANGDASITDFEANAAANQERYDATIQSITDQLKTLTDQYSESITFVKDDWSQFKVAIQADVDRAEADMMTQLNAVVWAQNHAYVVGNTTDANAINTPGSYNYGPNALNIPVSGSGTILHMNAGGNSNTQPMQIAYTYGNVFEYWNRFYGSSGWSAWERHRPFSVYDTTDLDTITQPGAYGFSTLTTNAPFEDAGNVQHYVLPNKAKLQIAVSQSYNPHMFCRWYSSSWSTWIKLSYFNNKMATDADTALDGATCMSSAATGTPVATYGTLMQWPISSNKLQLFVSWEAIPRIFMRRRASGTWGPWSAPLASVLDAAAKTVPNTGAGMKIVPLAMTLPGSNTTRASGTGGVVRFNRQYAHRPSRVRVHIGNVHPRFGAVSGATDLTGVIRIGVGDGTGRLTNATPEETVTIKGSGAYAVTPWLTCPAELVDGGFLSVNVAWTGPDTIIQNMYGGCWTGTYAQRNHTVGDALTRSDSSAPFHVWVEAEVPNRVPVIMFNGDSISCGVGTTDVIGASFGSQYCLENGAIPVHMAMSGSTLSVWGDEENLWNMYAGCDLMVIDAILTQLGVNDLTDGITLDTLQTRYLKVTGKFANKFPNKPIYSTAITPSLKSADVEAVRRSFNAWRASLPSGERGVIPWDVPLSVDGQNEDMSSAYSSDNLHPNNAGVTVMVAELDKRPLVPWTPSASKLKAVLGTVY